MRTRNVVACGYRVVAGDFTVHTIYPRNPTGQKVTVVLPGKLIERYYKYTPVAYENL